MYGLLSNRRVHIQKVRHDSALVTLEQRFARGEIDSDEFKKRRQELLGG
jgi:uncharacterized membrane protein